VFCTKIINKVHTERHVSYGFAGKTITPYEWSKKRHQQLIHGHRSGLCGCHCTASVTVARPGDVPVENLISCPDCGHKRVQVQGFYSFGILPNVIIEGNPVESVKSFCSLLASRTHQVDAQQIYCVG